MKKGFEIKLQMVMTSHLNLIQLTNYQLKNVNLEVGDGYHTRFDDASFDIVILFNSLQIVKEPEKLLSEAYRLLKKDSYIVLATDCYSEKLPFSKKIYSLVPRLMRKLGIIKYLNCFTKNDFEILIKESNFAILQTDILYHVPINYFILAKKVKQKYSMKKGEINMADEFIYLWHELLKTSTDKNMETNFHDFIKLSTNEIAIIQMVSHNPNIILGEICVALDMPKSTLTNVINRLEKSGYLTRTISKRDMRSYGLLLSEKGILAQKEHKEYELFLANGILNALDSDKERKTLIDLMKKISDNISNQLLYLRYYYICAITDRGY